MVPEHHRTFFDIYMASLIAGFAPETAEKWLDLKSFNTLAGPLCHVRVTRIGAWALKNRPFPTIFGHLTHIWPTLLGMLA